jgi:alpha-N-arabinofuranosidase
MINTHWGGVVEDNSFGTHEFMDLVEQLGTDAYVTGNVGSGTPQEMMEWVEYMTSDAISPMANLRRQNGREKPWPLPYFGVANEPWGCGGNMRAEYYADEYRKYNTFVKNYDRAKPVYRIAAGASGDDYRWTEVMMRVAGRQMDGLSLHYYTLPTGSWGKKGAATGFTENLWFATLRQTLRMDELITKHDEVMDKAEAEIAAGRRRGPGMDRKIGLVVDEWGTWYDQEPGSTPGFLYQQNSLRDALVAALNFHIFHKHADRVTMANIAQTVNVLQAMILTAKEKMLRTPTYWVFEMFKVHQGGTFLPVELQSPDYVFDQDRIPMLSASATRAAGGSAIHLSLANSNPTQAATLTVKLAGVTPKAVSGRVLTAQAMDAHNTFEAPNAVQPAAFSGATVKGDTLEVKLPAKSVVILTLN